MKFFNLKKFVKYSYFLLWPILILIIFKEISLFDLSIIIKSWKQSLVIISLSLIFILTKSYSLLLVSRMNNLKETYFDSIKIFCMSAFIEITTLSGKIGNDGFKFLYWNKLKRRKRVSILLFLRSADLFAFIFLILAFYYNNFLILFFPLIIFLAILITQTKNEKPVIWAKISTLSTISLISLSIQFLVAYSTVGLGFSLLNAKYFLSSHALGAISFLPFGLGVKDFSLYLQLKNIISKEQIILGLIWIRLLGEFFSAFLGGIFYVNNVKNKKK